MPKDFRAASYNLFPSYWAMSLLSTCETGVAQRCSVSQYSPHCAENPTACHKEILQLVFLSPSLPKCNTLAFTGQTKHVVTFVLKSIFHSFLSWKPELSVPPFLAPDSSMENAASPPSRYLLQIWLLDDAELIRIHKCNSIMDVAVAHLITSFAHTILSFMRFTPSLSPGLFYSMDPKAGLPQRGGREENERIWWKLCDLCIQFIWVTFPHQSASTSWVPASAKLSSKYISRENTSSLERFQVTNRGISIMLYVCVCVICSFANKKKKAT